MTTPSPCERLDAYLDGHLEPDAEAAFEVHLETCETCVDATALSDTEAAALADFAAVSCPPAVLHTALAQAHRSAADRVPAPGRHRTRRTFAWVGLAAALAVAAASTQWLSQPASEPAPLVADATPPEARPAPPMPPVDAPDDEGDARAPSPTPASNAGTAPPDRARPRTARPTPPPATPEAEPRPNHVATPDSVAIARDEMLLALAIVADAQGRASAAVASGVGLVATTLHASPLSSPPTP